MRGPDASRAIAFVTTPLHAARVHRRPGAHEGGLAIDRRAKERPDLPLLQSARCRAAPRSAAPLRTRAQVATAAPLGRRVAPGFPFTSCGCTRWGPDRVGDAIGVRVRLCGRTGSKAELRHHCHLVEHAPVLAGQTVLAEPDDVDHLDAHALTGCGHTHELAIVGAGELHTSDCLVGVHKNVLGSHFMLGKAADIVLNSCLVPSRPVGMPGISSCSTKSSASRSMNPSMSPELTISKKRRIEAAGSMGKPPCRVVGRSADGPRVSGAQDTDEARATPSTRSGATGRTQSSRSSSRKRPTAPIRPARRTTALSNGSPSGA